MKRSRTILTFFDRYLQAISKTAKHVSVFSLKVTASLVLSMCVEGLWTRVGHSCVS